MRFSLRFPRASRCVIVVAALLAPPAVVRASPGPDPAYAFAQQKVYGMTITAENGVRSFVTAKPFSVTMHTSATYDAIGTQTFSGGLERAPRHRHRRGGGIARLHARGAARVPDEET